MKMVRLEEIQSKFVIAHAHYRSAGIEVHESKQKLEKAESDYTNSEEARQIVQLVSQSVQQMVHNRIASLVSRCMETVFDEPYEFRIDFERKRGRTEAKLTFERDGSRVDPMTASGGGVVDVASFALRLACLMLARPQLRRLIVMDEPFRFLSVDYRQRVKDMMDSLAKEMGIQFVLVTHMDDLRIGKVIEV